MSLAGDVKALWHDPATPMRERKRIARLLIEDVERAERGRAMTLTTFGRRVVTESEAVLKTEGVRISPTGS